MKIKTEPAVVTSAIVAVLGFLAPTIVVGDTQKALITGGFYALFAILGGLHIRGKVTPTSVLEAAKEEAVGAAKTAAVEVEQHPEQVAAVLESLTTGEHPMNKMPVAGLDPSIPDPQPQGAYDAATAPNPLVKDVEKS